MWRSGEERASVRLPGGALLSARRAQSELGRVEGFVGGPRGGIQPARTVFFLFLFSFLS
jgi:hypothetical protein